MTDEELRAALAELASSVVELHKDRDDILVGSAAALLDIHRLLIDKGLQTEAEALARLDAQKGWLVRNVLDQVGSKYLGWLRDVLATGKLDAAKWLRTPPAGTA